MTRALSFLESFKSRPDGWSYCLDRIFSPNDPPGVTFMCLQTLDEVVRQRYASVGREGRGRLHTELTRWVRERLPMQNAAALPQFVLNKFAAVYAVVAREDYPETWRSCFRDLLEALQGGGTRTVDMFTRILTAVDEEIVRPTTNHLPGEQERGTVVKDAMRDDCVKALAEAWHWILVTFSATEPALARAALSNIAAYVDWIDITLIANDRFVPLLYSFITAGESAGGELREGACICLEHIVDKGASASDKVALLKFLGLERVLRVASSGPSSHLGYDMALAKLVASVCHILLDTGPLLAKAGKGDEVETVAALLDHMVPLLLGLANHSNDDVTRYGRIFSFSHSILHILLFNSLTLTHTLTHTHSHPRTQHTHTHTHTHTQTCTHTHTHNVCIIMIIFHSFIH